MMKSILLTSALFGLTTTATAQQRVSSNIKADVAKEQTLAAITLRTVTVNLPNSKSYDEYKGRILADGRSNNVKGEEFFVYWGGSNCPGVNLPDWTISKLVDAVIHQPDIGVVYEDGTKQNTLCIASINWW